jgi:hypothetical protein
MMKVVPMERRRPARNFVAIAGIVSIPIFGAIFYLTYTMLRQLSPATSLLILVAGIGVVAYLVYIFAKARK